RSINPKDMPTAKTKAPAKSGLSLNIQHDYITLRTPTGNYTSSYGGEKISGQLGMIPGAFTAINKYIDTETKVNKRNFGEVMNDLLDPKLMDRLAPGWDKPKTIDIAPTDKVKFSEGIIAKKYP